MKINFIIKASVERQEKDAEIYKGVISFLQLIAALFSILASMLMITNY